MVGDIRKHTCVHDNLSSLAGVTSPACSPAPPTRTGWGKGDGESAGLYFHALNVDANTGDFSHSLGITLQKIHVTDVGTMLGQHKAGTQHASVVDLRQETAPGEL